jgi:predicted MFS family arabinose efflux permease
LDLYNTSRLINDKVTKDTGNIAEGIGKEMKKETDKIAFTSYQKFVIFILAVTQFSVVLDFMIMSPMGDILMKVFTMKPAEFGAAVSGYAFSAGISGLLTAGFADKFDRKKLLLFFYTGFIIGTILCGVSNSYRMLLIARIVTGLFGGVIGSISMAIIADLFGIHQRGRVMGFVQMGFGASQVLGIPLGLFLANNLGWRAPFILIAAFAVVIATLILTKLKPVIDHLAKQLDTTPFRHLLHTFSKRSYRITFLATAFLSVGGFMMMPFGSAFAVNNLKITQEQLPMLFFVSGFSSLIIMPMIGRVADKIDKFALFASASAWMIFIVLIYTNLSATPLWLVMAFNVLMMMGIMSRMVPAGALTTAVPDLQDRGAFMSINSSLQQMAGGVAAASAGLIVKQANKSSPLYHYNTLGYVMAGVSLLSVLLLYRVSVLVKKKLGEKKL